MNDQHLGIIVMKRYSDPSKWKSQQQDVAIGTLGLRLDEVVVMFPVGNDISM